MAPPPLTRTVIPGMPHTSSAAAEAQASGRPAAAAAPKAREVAAVARAGARRASRGADRSAAPDLCTARPRRQACQGG